MRPYLSGYIGSTYPRWWRLGFNVLYHGACILTLALHAIAGGGSDLLFLLTTSTMVTIYLVPEYNTPSQVEAVERGVAAEGAGVVLARRAVAEVAAML